MIVENNVKESEDIRFKVDNPLSRIGLYLTLKRRFRRRGPPKCW